MYHLHFNYASFPSTIFPFLVCFILNHSCTTIHCFQKSTYREHLLISFYYFRSFFKMKICHRTGSIHSIRTLLHKLSRMFFILSSNFTSHYIYIYRTSIRSKIKEKPVVISRCVLYCTRPFYVLKHFLDYNIPLGYAWTKRTRDM